MNYIIYNQNIYLLFNSILKINTILLIISAILLVIVVIKSREKRLILSWIIIALISFIPRILYIILKVPNVFENYIKIHEMFFICVEFIIRIIMIIYNLRCLKNN